MIKVAVTGAAGRMGSGIIRKITQQDDMEVVAAIEIPNSPLAGVDAGIQAGAGELGVKIVGAEKLEETLKESKADVLVDFTIAHAAVETVKKATACASGRRRCYGFLLGRRLGRRGRQRRPPRLSVCSGAFVSDLLRRTPPGGRRQYENISNRYRDLQLGLSAKVWCLCLRPEPRF